MYAGFWKRFGAYILDFILLSVASIIFIFIWAGFELLLNALGVDQKTKENILGDLGIPIYFLMPWFYYAFFESSKLMATPGKIIVGLLVVGQDGKKISFLRATARFFSKMLSALILFIGFILAGLTEKKQALHDLIANTYVVNKISVPKVSDETPENTEVSV